MVVKWMKKQIRMLLTAGCVIIIQLATATIPTMADEVVYTAEYKQECPGIDGFENAVKTTYNSRLSAETLLNGTSATDKYRDQLDSDSQRVYDILYEAYCNGPSSAEVDLQFAVEAYPGQIITVQGNTATVSDDLQATVKEKITNALTPAMYAILYDHPEMGWVVNAAYVYSYEWGFSNITTISGSQKRATVKLTKVTFYYNSSNIYTDSGDKESVDAAIEEAKAALEAEPYNILSASTTEAKVKAIHDYICDTVTYTTGSTSLRIYQTAYSALTGTKTTVCAGYSKAFKLLCEEYDIPCVLVSGWGVTSQNGSGESHMWNYVRMKDNNWYAVDCTWDDQKTKIYYDFYLVGASTEDIYFGGRTFESSHVANPFWQASETSSFRYPTLSASKFDVTAEEPSEDPADPPSEDPTDPPTEDPADPPAEDPTDPPTEDPTDPPAEDPTDPSTDPSTGNTTDKSDSISQAVLFEDTWLPVGTIKTDKAAKAIYRVIAQGEVSYANTNKKAKTIIVPQTVVIDGKTYRVTAIADNACKNNAQLKKITIPDGIKKIGKNALANCKKLKTIVIKSTSIKSVGSKAFKGIASNAKIKVPKKVKKSYTKLFKKKGIGTKVKIV